MERVSRVVTLDSNVFIAAVKADEPYSDRCLEIISGVPDSFILIELTIVYQEVCGALARRVGTSVAEAARKQLDRIIDERLLADCDRAFCVSSHPLCSKYGIYAIDALYVNAAISGGSVLVSLEKEDLVDRLKAGRFEIEACHVSEFPH